MMTVGLEIEGLSKYYPGPGGGDGRVALEDVNLSVAPGEFVCLLGPSGCGKTTLLNIIAGLDADYRGSLTFTPEMIGKPKIGFVFQDARLLPWLTVKENLRFVLEGGDASEDTERNVARWIRRVGLAGYENYYPNQLSIGMQQRVALARALMIEPDFLLMDEPFSSLDELTASRMRDELVRLRADKVNTVVFVTHNPLEAVYLADRVVIMSSGPGRIVKELDSTKMLPRPRSADDEMLWRLARRAVRMLEGAGGDSGGEGR